VFAGPYQLLIAFLLLRFFVFGLASQLSMQGLSHLPRRAQPRAPELLHLAHLLFDQPFGLLTDRFPDRLL